MQCNVCGTRINKPLFLADSERGLTSLCELREVRVSVWACGVCGHLCSDELSNIDAYYDTDYRILLSHEDEDQIYELNGDRPIYRTDHQAAVLLEKLNLPVGAFLLDYGCAKASTPRRLLTQRPDLQVHLFDVSDMYISYWDKVIPAEQYSTYNVPEQWQQRFDIVTSFFALEHIAAPLQTVQRIAALLKDDGVFYGIVPDTFGNVADFVVVDHINHFTLPSLHYLLTKAGFAQIKIDNKSHRGALVFIARKSGSASVPPDIDSVLRQAGELAGYWAMLGGRIREAEKQYRNLEAAIYGSGFYGAYIASSLNHFERVQCFLDRSTYQQGKLLFDRPILVPESLPADVKVIYIGLNPAIARSAIAQMDWLRARDVSLVFLDGEGDD